MDDTKIYYLENTTGLDIVLMNITVPASGSITLFDKANLSTSMVWCLQDCVCDDSLLNEKVGDGSLVFKEGTTSKTVREFFTFLQKDFPEYDNDKLIIKDTQIRLDTANTRIIITDNEGNKKYITYTT